MMEKIDVAVGIIRDNQDNIFITKRHQNTHQGGLWEFPGGKREEDEARQAALYRELKEELGIEVIKARPFLEIAHQYSDKHVLLDVWEVTEFSGEPTGLEGQPARWAELSELSNFEFPEADKPIIKALQLPASYAISPNLEQIDEVVHRLKIAMDNGIELIQLRVPKVPESDIRAAANQLLTHAAQYPKVKLLLNRDIDLAQSIGFHGVHLSAKQLLTLNQSSIGYGFWTSASCHDIDELHLAESKDVDFVVLSPVLPTATHPDATALGWDNFQKLVSQVNLPVYALGGMQKTDFEMARQRGGIGVAGIGAFC
jgi:8-oxo-dGTP diphosphatase